MRYTVALFPLAGMGSVSDPCNRLCQLDGPLICTDGSYQKNGVCHRYLFRGDPSLDDYCYHTSETASTCPSTGNPVRVADAERFIASRAEPNGERVHSTTIAPSASVTRSRPRPRRPTREEFEASVERWLANATPEEIELRTEQMRARIDEYTRSRHN